MSKLHQQGYELIAGGRSLNIIRRDYGHQIVGKKNTYNAPKDYTPDRNDDRSKSYHPGSTIANEQGDVFMCISAEPQQANWVKLATIEDATPGSFVNYNPQQEASEEPYPETEGVATEKIAEGPAPASQDHSPDKKLDPEADTDVPAQVDAARDPKPKPDPKNEAESHPFMTADSGPHGKTALPEDVPYKGWLDKNDITTVEALEQNLEGLAELPYFNEDRADKVIAWFNEN